MARQPEITADVTVEKVDCHACRLGIPALSVVFMRAPHASTPVDATPGSSYPLCRVCFEREMTRRIEEARP